MDTSESNSNRGKRPNILILCMDQWDTHMDVPEEVEFPALERLEQRLVVVADGEDGQLRVLGRELADGGDDQRSPVARPLQCGPGHHRPHV